MLQSFEEATQRPVLILHPSMQDVQESPPVHVAHPPGQTRHSPVKFSPYVPVRKMNCIAYSFHKCISNYLELLLNYLNQAFKMTESRIRLVLIFLILFLVYGK